MTTISDDEGKINEESQSWEVEVDMEKLWEEMDGPGEDEENGLWVEGPEPVVWVEDDLFLMDDTPAPAPAPTLLPATTASTMSTPQSPMTTNTNSSMPLLSFQDLQQRLSSDVSYFYLKDELGLSEEVMWKITHDAGSALGMKASTIREKVDVLRSTMDLSPDDLQRIFALQPTILHLSAKKNLAPTILFLVRQLDLTKQNLRILVVTCPCILCYSIDNLHKKLLFFQETMGYTMEECRELLCTEPKLLMAGVQEGLLPRYRFLTREMEFPKPEVRALIQRNPRILLKSLDQNLRPKIIYFLIMMLHMTSKEVFRLLQKYPPLLDYSLEDHFRPTLQYLISLDFSAYEVGRMWLKSPRMVTYSLPTIKHVVGYLRYELGLEAMHVRRVLYQAPQVVGLTTENLQSKVDFFKQQFQVLALHASRNPHGDSKPGPGKDCDSYDDDKIRKLIVGMPTLLNLSIESNLRPKIEYLKEQMGPEELAAALDRLPTLLGYSLVKRIQPRMEAIIKAGADPGCLTIGIPMKEENFVAWLQSRVEKRSAKKLIQYLSKKSKSSPLLLPNMDNNPGEGGKQGNKTVNFIQEQGGRIAHWRRH